MARMGTLATGLAGGMLAEGARQWAQGKRPSARDLLLTPANARRVADQLAQQGDLEDRARGHRQGARGLVGSADGGVEGGE